MNTIGFFLILTKSLKYSGTNLMSDSVTMHALFDDAIQWRLYKTLGHLFCVEKHLVCAILRWCVEACVCLYLSMEKMSWKAIDARRMGNACAVPSTIFYLTKMKISNFTGYGYFINRCWRFSFHLQIEFLFDFGMILTKQLEMFFFSIVWIFFCFIVIIVFLEKFSDFVLISDGDFYSKDYNVLCIKRSMSSSATSGWSVGTMWPAFNTVASMKLSAFLT